MNAFRSSVGARDVFEPQNHFDQLKRRQMYRRTMHALNDEELMRESSLVAGDPIVGIHLCLNVRFWSGSFGILRDENQQLEYLLTSSVLHR
jgi:hypothetical protein